MKTVVGLYDDFAAARQVVEELNRAGFDRQNISLVASDRDKVYAEELQAEGAVAGALAGGALGGLGGVLLGLGALAIPGVGPIIAAGPIAAGLTGAAIGAAAGGLLGALASWGIPEEEAGYYAEGVRRGGTLVGVTVEESQVDRVKAIMNRFGLVDIQTRSSEWRSAGWTGFDPNAGDYVTETGWRNYDTRWRTHYDQYYGRTGHNYDYYLPGYRYGYTVANDPRYTGRDWDLIEADVRRDWEATAQGAWEDFKDSIRYGWNEVKQAFR
jgi:uncharacterized membrane protein